MKTKTIGVLSIVHGFLILIISSLSIAVVLILFRYCGDQDICSGNYQLKLRIAFIAHVLFFIQSCLYIVFFYVKDYMKSIFQASLFVLNLVYIATFVWFTIEIMMLESALDNAFKVMQAVLSIFFGFIIFALIPVILCFYYIRHRFLTDA